MKINDLTEMARICKTNGEHETGCPTCGAEVEEDHCPNCGTTFIDYACIETDQPFYVKFKRGGEIHIRQVRQISIEQGVIIF